MVDGVDKDPHVPHHGQAAGFLGGGVGLLQQLFHIAVGGPGIHPAAADGDEGLAAAVLGQPQHRPGVALGEVIFQDELLLVGGELKQPQFVGQGGLGHPQPLGGLGLGAAPEGQHVLQAPGLLKGVQVGPLDVFQQAQGGGLVVLIVPQDGGHPVHAGQLAGPQPPLPCDQLVPVGAQAADRHRLQQPILPDAGRQPRQLLLVKDAAGLIRRGLDLLHRQRHHLPHRFSAVKHGLSSFP